MLKMITNLFSIFDPSILKINIGWTVLLIPLLIIFNRFKFNISYKISSLFTNILTFLSKELKALISPFNKKFSINLIITLFFYFLILNLLALTPFSFTPTAHLSVSFTIALTLWLSFIMFGWSKNFSSIIAHMVPSGTPNQLMNFIVVIELVRNIIRPITLSVRLSANIVAGHLLISLLGSFCLSSLITLWSFPLILILSILEVGVSLIQAYVLITLITLYSTEVH